MHISYFNAFLTLSHSAIVLFNGVSFFVGFGASFEFLKAKHLTCLIVKNLKHKFENSLVIFNQCRLLLKISTVFSLNLFFFVSTFKLHMVV